MVHDNDASGFVSAEATVVGYARALRAP